MSNGGQNSWDPLWNDVFSSQEWGKYPSEQLIRFVARNFYATTRKDVRILEVGCGTGANIWYVSREGFDAFGIDGSEVALNIGRERLEKEGLTAGLTRGDILSLPYEDGFFNAVLDCECIYCNNTQQSRKILKEIHRVLKPGGKLYSQTFSNSMYVGEDAIRGENPLEVQRSSNGPLYNKGFSRLSTMESIHDLYGRSFRLESVDILEYTGGNKAYLVSEWIIIGRKD